MDLPEGSDVWDFEENSTRYEICYTKESIRHPAKMNIPLCREIFKKYTKKGDLVLDPMGGIGTSAVEGCLLGRNVICVEYEQRFVDMAKANIKLVQEKMSFLKGLGKAVIVKGDSRELFKVLEDLEKGGSPDAILFSPPFSKVTMEKKPSENWKGPDFSKQVYSEDKNDESQVGNLDYEPLENGGENIIASGLESAPFSNANPCGDKARASDYSEKWKQQGVKGGAGFLTKTYSESPENLGNLNYGMVDAIVSSPPFSGATKGAGIAKDAKWKDRIMSYRQSGATESDNLGNLQADAIVTSPPYGHESYVTRSDKKRTDKWSKELTLLQQENYSEDPSNCRNLKGKSYLSEMFLIYQQCFLVLKNGGTMVLVLKNFVKQGKTVRLDQDTIKIVEASGFKFYCRHYRKIRSPSFWIINAIKKWEKKFPDKPHPYPMFEDVIVFKKEVESSRERELMLSCSAPLLQTVSVQEQILKSLEAKEAGKQTTNTAKTLRTWETLNTDVIIFSPPFAETNQGKGAFKNHEQTCNCAFCKKCKGNAGEVQGIAYSPDKNNIGNLRYGA